MKKQLLSLMLAVCMAFSALSPAFAENINSDSVCWKFDFGAFNQNADGYYPVTKNTVYGENNGYGFKFGFLGIDDNAHKVEKYIDGISTEEGQQIVLQEGEKDIIETANDDYIGIASQEDGKYPIRFSMEAENNHYYKVKVTVTGVDQTKQVNATVFSERRHPIITNEVIGAGENKTVEFVATLQNVCMKRYHPNIYKDDMLNVVVLGDNVAVSSIEVTEVEHQQTMWLYTDSTGCDQDAMQPYFELENFGGVGQYLTKYLPENITISNQGEGGINAADTTHWETANKNIQAGDYVYVQHGHNHNDPLEYLEAISKYYKFAHNKGAKTIYVGPISRHRETNYCPETNTWTSSLSKFSTAAKYYTDVLVCAGEEKADAFINKASVYGLESGYAFADEIIAQGITADGVNDVAFIDLNEPTLRWMEQVCEDVKLIRDTLEKPSDAEKGYQANAIDYYFRSVKNSVSDQTHPNDAGADNMAYLFFEQAKNIITKVDTSDILSVQAEVVKPLVTNMREASPYKVSEEMIKAGPAPNNLYPDAYVNPNLPNYPTEIKDIKFDENGEIEEVVVLKQQAKLNMNTYGIVVITICDENGKEKGKLYAQDIVDDIVDGIQTITNFKGNVTLSDSDTYSAIVMKAIYSEGETGFIVDENSPMEYSVEYTPASEPSLTPTPTSDTGILSTEFTEVIESNDNISVTVHSNINTEAVLFYAEFDVMGTLKTINSYSLVLGNGDCSCLFPSNHGAFKKLFLWENLNSMMPLCNAYGITDNYNVNKDSNSSNRILNGIQADYDAERNTVTVLYDNTAPQKTILIVRGVPDAYINPNDIIAIDQSDYISEIRVPENLDDGTYTVLMGGDGNVYSCPFTVESYSERYLVGDADSSLLVDISDASMILAHDIGNVNLDDISLMASDCNFDGNINSRDALAILKFINSGSNGDIGNQLTEQEYSHAINKNQETDIIPAIAKLTQDKTKSLGKKIVFDITYEGFDSLKSLSAYIPISKQAIESIDVDIALQGDMIRWAYDEKQERIVISCASTSECASQGKVATITLNLSDDNYHDKLELSDFIVTTGNDEKISMATSITDVGFVPEFITSKPDDIEYSGTNGSCAWLIDNGKLTIQGNGEMNDFGEGKAPWYPAKESITSVDIGSGIRNIGANAFYGCDHIIEITMADSIVTLGNSCFKNCSKLNRIDLNDNLTGIGQSAFEGCSLLNDLTIPKNILTISKGIAAGCKNLQSISIPYIGSSSNDKSNTFSYIFGNSDNIPFLLKDIEITNAKFIPDNAFANCEFIETIKLNSEIDSIGINAFSGCLALKKLSLPDDIKKINDGVFNDCISLQSINIPEYVKQIGEKAFYNCKSIDELILPRGLESIGSYAFAGCKEITNIILPDSVTILGENILEECTALTSIKLPFTGLTRDDSKNTFNCIFNTVPDSLKRVTITDDEYITDYDFQGCTHIEDIIVKQTSEVGRQAFENCSSLINIELPNDTIRIGEDAFKKCTKLETMKLPFIGSSRNANKNIDSVFGYLFGYQDTNITALTTEQYYTDNDKKYYFIPKSLTDVEITDSIHIPYGAFMNCSNIKNITVNTSATIYDRAFYNCKGLKYAVLPQDLGTIEKEAFAGCSNLIGVKMPENSKDIKIGDNVFYNCHNLQRSIIPENVKEISLAAFENCDNISIYGYPGTYAEKYANDNAIEFKLLSADDNLDNILYGDDYSEETTMSAISKRLGDYVEISVDISDKTVGMLIVAIYDDDNTLVSMDRVDVNVVKQSYILTLPINGGMNAKVFLWNDLNIGRPIADAVTIDSI